MEPKIIMKLIDNIIKHYSRLKFRNFTRDEREAFAVLKTRRVSPVCIMPAIDRMENELLKNMLLPIKRGLTYLGYMGGKKITLLKGGIGSVSTLHFIDALKRGGAKTILRVDVCGAFDGNVGDIIIAEDCIPADAFTGQLTDSNSIPADTKLLELAKVSVNDLDISNSVRFGKLITVDRYYDQTDDDHIKWSKDAIGVDMETSMLYYGSRERSIRTLSLLCVSDVKYIKEDFSHDPHNFPFRNYRNGIKNLIKLTRAILKKL
jgi:purine-nucleoside phosphorylase